MPISVPKYIHTPDNIVNVLQLSDLHLYADSNRLVAGINLFDNFIACLDQALNEDIRCDLILVTGDLVNEMETSIYDCIFDILQKTGIDYACIPGNHDVTDEVGQHLPFEKRILVAYEPDTRLIHQHRIVATDWQILLVDSSMPGEVSGRLSADTRHWLDSTLGKYDNPAVIYMHHHTIAMQSKWLDTHISQDSDLFWQLIAKYPQVKVVVNGHVHQDYASVYNDVTVYSTPSTCYQFKKHSDNFALDKTAMPGYRWLQLKPNAQFTSWVKRLAKLTQRNLSLDNSATDSPSTKNL